MKRILAKILSIFAVLLLVLSMTTANVFAANTSQDGLAVYTMTDKDSYKEGEKAIVFIAVENTNGYDMENVNVTISLPEELSLSETQDFNIPLLKADEIKEYKITIEKNSDEITITPDNPTTDNNNTETDLTNNIDNAGSKVDTSDNYVIIGFVILLGLSLTVILIVKMGEKCKKVLIIALISTMAVSLFNIGNVNAKNTSIEQKEISTIQNIIYDNNTYPLNVKVAYSKENGEIVDSGEITREEWLTKLVDIMGYTAEFETYSFHDFDKASNPDKIETAIQYGLVELTPNADNMVLFSPREYATREFVAYSTIKALGFYTCNTSVVCNDNDILMYPEADKLMVHYGMFKLVNNNFNPYQFVSNKEVEIIVDKIKEINDSTSINPDAENKIEYTENTKQYTLDFNLDEEQKIITSNDTVLNDLKQGDTAILNHSYVPENSIAIIVDSINNEDGTYTINYSIPNIEKIVNNMHVEGVTDNQNATFIPADDVTIDNVPMTRSGITGEIPFNQSLSLNTKIGFVESNIKLSFIGLQYRFDMNWSFFKGLKIKEIYLAAALENTISSKATIGINGNEDKDIKKKLGDINAPIGGGFNSSFEVYLVAKIDGSFGIEVESEAKLGAQYRYGNLRGIASLSSEVKKLEASAELRIGARPQLDLEFLGIADLIQIYGEMGLNIDGTLSVIDLNPYKYCFDSNNYIYFNTGAQIGLEALNLKYEKEIFNKDFSPYKKSAHFEENGFVPECTRGRNYFEGIIIESGTIDKTIANAKIQVIDKNNNIIDEVYSDNKGYFITNKIRNDEYTIYVFAPEYEEYTKKINLTNENVYLEIGLTKKDEDPDDGDETDEAITIEKGKTVRLYGCRGGKLYYSGTQGTIIDRAWHDKRSNYNGVNGIAYINENVEGTSWISLNNNEYYDITVLEGNLIIEEDTFKSGIILEEINTEAVSKYILKQGEKITIKDKNGIGYYTQLPIFVNTKNGAGHVKHKKEEVLETEEYDVLQNTVDNTPKKIAMFGREHEVTVTCTSGTITVYVRNDDKSKVEIIK